MSDETKRKVEADSMFRTDIKVADFAKGLANLPQLGDMLRLAGLQDGRTMAGVKMTSSRLNAIRARAVGDKRAIKRAEAAEAQATRLAKAMHREETRVRPEESILGNLAGMAGKFRLYGKVLDEKGQPVPNAQVEVAGKDTGVLFTARTDKDGIYDLAMAVGANDDQADDGEGLMAQIKKDGMILKAAVGGLIKEGGMLHKIMTVPPIDTIKDLAAPITTDRPTVEEEVPPPKSPKVPIVETPVKDEAVVPTKPRTPVKPRTPKAEVKPTKGGTVRGRKRKK